MSLALVVTSILSPTVQAQRNWESSFFYVVDGRTQTLLPKLDRYHVAIGPDETADVDEALQQLFGAADQAIKTISTRSGTKHIIVSTPDQTTEAIRGRLQVLRQDPRFIGSGPVFDLGTSLAFASDEIVIRFRPGLTRPEREEELLKHGLELLAEYPPLSGRVLARGSQDPFSDSNKLYWHDSVQYSSPNFYYETEEAAVTPCAFPGGQGFDALSQNQWQWNLACIWQAWDIAGRGDADVKVYVSDGGVDDDHQDLAANLVEVVNFSNEVSTWKPVQATFTSTHTDAAVYLFNRSGLGQAIIDNVSLRRTSGDTSELISNGDFSAGQGGWQFLGSHAASAIVTDGDPQHANVLQLENSTETFNGTNCVKLTINPLPLGVQFVFKVDIKFASKEVNPTAKLSKPADFFFAQPNVEVQLLGYVDQSHGTNVTGILVADDNAVGLLGVAPDCKALFSSKPPIGFFDVFTEASALYWAANQGARVLNFSWLVPLQTDDFVRAVRKVAEDSAGGKGAVFTVAAGNYGNSQIPDHYIGSHPLVLAVGATNLLDNGNGTFTERRWCGGSFGDALDIVAPNTRTVGGQEQGWALDDANNTFILPPAGVAGTSYTAPFVGGVVALLISLDPNLAREEIFQILFHTASRDLSASDSCSPPGSVDLIDTVTGWSKHYGHGRINAEAALEAVDHGVRWPAPVPDFQVEPRRSGASLFWAIKWTNPSLNLTKVVVVKGLTGQRVSFSPQDGQTFQVGQLVSNNQGKVIYAGAGTSVSDPEQAPTGLRHYMIFTLNESQEVDDQQNPVVVNRYSFGKEVLLRKGNLFVANSMTSLATVLATNDLEGGDLVVVENGAYSLPSTLTITPSDGGNSTDGHVFVMGASVPTTTMGAHFSLAGGTILSIAAPHVTVKHLAFDSSGTGIVVDPMADNVRLVSNRVTGCSVGIRLGATGTQAHNGPVLVQNCIVRNLVGQAGVGAKAIWCPKRPNVDNGMAGLYSIINNTIDMEQGMGVDLDFDAADCGSTCFQAFGITKGNTVEIYNNVILCDSGACISVEGKLISNNNALIGTPTGIASGVQKTFLSDWRSAVLADKDTISQDPQLDASYNPSPTSPCINRGRSVGLMSGSLYPYDYSAGNRVSVGEIDIGAEERASVDLGEQFIRGDANEDGAVNISDGNWITNYLFSGGQESVCLETNDVNDDEVVDISDVVYVLFSLFNTTDGLMRWIPLPWPDCGEDPYGFELFCSTASPACP